MKHNKKAAMEMTMGTIVTIVLLVSVMVLGLVFVRNIMCAGIIITEDITTGTTNEIKNLFNTREYGIKCMGEGGQEVKLGGGGSRWITCVINTDSKKKFNLTIDSITSLKGESTEEINENWALDPGASGTVSPGDFKVVGVLLLDIPKDVSTTILKVKINEMDDDGTVKDTYVSIVNIVPAGGLTTAIC